MAATTPSVAEAVAGHGTAPARAAGWGSGGLDGRAAHLRRRYPTVADLMARARRRTPRFAYDFVAGGVGDDLCLARNRAALDAIAISPRLGLDMSRVDTAVQLFGRDYRAPFGVAPMGLAGLLWPGVDEALARAAQRARIPYVLSTVANTTIERVGALAPDVFWYQLYGVPGNDHAVSFDLVARAERAGAHALVVTLDVPVRSKRTRDVRNGLVVPFRPTLRTALDVARAPQWGLAMLRHGQPRFENFLAYAGAEASTADLASYVFQKMTGPMTWETVARLREAWPRAFLVKGLLHPDDAEKAVSLGVDGIVVSNHGGRQFDAAPASIDALAEIAARVGGRTSLVVDGGMMNGLDLLRALGRGADAAFAGRAFLFGYGALGEEGGEHVARLFEEELRLALAQSGSASVAEARGASPTT